VQERGQPAPFSRWQAARDVANQEP
jgi:hypothetical protein